MSAFLAFLPSLLSAQCTWTGFTVKFPRTTHKFFFRSDACLTYILLSPPKVMKCFIKMQEPCKDWKWVGQDKIFNSPSHARAGYFPHCLHWDLTTREYLQQCLFQTLFLLVLRLWAWTLFLELWRTLPDPDAFNLTKLISCIYLIQLPGHQFFLE